MKNEDTYKYITVNLDKSPDKKKNKKKTCTVTKKRRQRSKLKNVRFITRQTFVCTETTNNTKTNPDIIPP